MIFSHSGFTGTFVAAVPEEKLSIVLLTNRQNKGLRADGYYEELEALDQELLEILTSRFPSPS